VDINGTFSNYVGEMVLALDSDFQVKWACDAFEYLDVNPGPVLGEVVAPGSLAPFACTRSFPGGDGID
jgi:hypothetical protein